ncbi:MAG: L-threonylcarbamoyladenylate synthase [Bryobacterales bacterium]|nr:L-threonylcarbamoyladenylate synthase [Bryobacteraceae bacterium]MDW8129675.1 L-threonylcarbamoyladenylate synthase [Bryobacterales bacterium]
MVCSRDIERAAELIRAGGLVAFPTETVYGLGANALDRAAVRRIFQVKGRPVTSPLIVHVDSPEMARRLAREWPPEAERLAQRFWPGPLTLVLPKAACIPAEVTAGLDTVGLRMPAHPVALELIRTAGVPIAAPSANRFTELSPTTAEHVRRALGDSVDMILDGGPTQVGLESTVLWLAGPPRLLRPGMILRRQIEEVIGPVEVAGRIEDGLPHPSPGLHPRHYSPRTPLVLVTDGVLPPGRGAYLWIGRPAAAARSVRMPSDAVAYAARLYDTLHTLDAEGWDWIAVERPPELPEWIPVLDRLRRAAGR